jgi:hypothetical protein
MSAPENETLLGFLIRTGGIVPKAPRFHFYLLDEDGEAVGTHDFLTWANWFNDSFPSRRIGYDEIGGSTVSTMFLALDHNFSATGPPLLWETMVFGGPEDGRCWRAASRTEALATHQEVVKRLKDQESG